MQFGMPTLIENESLEKNIDLCRRLGLNFIELNMNFPEYQTDRLEKTDKLIKLAKDAEIYYTIHLDENLNIADFNPLVRNAYLETVRRTIEVAGKLVPLKDEFGREKQPLVINMHMNHGIYITLPDKKVRMYERDFDTYMDYIIRFREKVEEWIGDEDIVICVENTDGFLDFEKKAIIYLLDSPKFFLTWDIGHSKATKEKDVPFILLNKKNLMHFHIHDGSEDPAKNHLALGDGEIDLASRLGYARDFDARCVLETKTIEALEKSVAWIRNYQNALYSEIEDDVEAVMNGDSDALLEKYVRVSGNFLANQAEATPILVQIAQADPMAFAIEWKKLVKEYRNEIATKPLYAYRIIGGLLYKVGEACEKHTGDIRYWRSIYKNMLDDTEVNEIVFKECCAEMSCESKLINCIFADGNTELLDEVIGYIFNNQNRKDETFSQVYRNFYYYECEDTSKKKAVSDIMEKYIKTIEDSEERNKCLGMFFELQWVPEDEYKA